MNNPYGNIHFITILWSVKSLLIISRSNEQFCLNETDKHMCLTAYSNISFKFKAPVIIISIYQLQTKTKDACLLHLCRTSAYK